MKGNRRNKADSLSRSSAVAVALLMVRTMQRVPLQLLWIIGQHLLHGLQRFRNRPFFQSSPFLPHKETHVSNTASLIPIHLHGKRKQCIWTDMKDLLSQLKQKCTSCRTMEECQLISPLGASGRAGDSLKMQGKHVEGWRTNISTKKADRLRLNQMCKYEQQS